MVKARAHYFFVSPTISAENERKVRCGLKNFPGFETTAFYHKKYIKGTCAEDRKPSEKYLARLGIKGERAAENFSLAPLDFYDYDGSLIKLFETFYRNSFDRELVVNVSGASVTAGSAATTALHMVGACPFEYSKGGGVFIEPLVPKIEKSLEFSDMERTVLRALKINDKLKPSEIVKSKNRAEISAASKSIAKFKELGLIREDDFTRYSLTGRGFLSAELVEVKERIDSERSKS
jgi:hypothetical protein